MVYGARSSSRVSRRCSADSRPYIGPSTAATIAITDTSRLVAFIPRRVHSPASSTLTCAPPARRCGRSTTPSRVSSNCTSVPAGKRAARSSGMCTAPSSSTTPKSKPCRPSEPIRPLRMVMLRGIWAATSGSWVTRTTVVPNSRLTTWISSSIASRSSWLSWEVGSSASSRPAPEDTADGEGHPLPLAAGHAPRAAGRRGSPMPSWSSSARGAGSRRRAAGASALRANSTFSSGLA